MEQQKSTRHRFFSHRSCEFFPCHEGVPEDEFNCLFCYCPLYALGPKCGGNFKYTSKGVKSCIDCSVMHRGDEGYERLAEHFKELSELARED